MSITSDVRSPISLTLVAAAVVAVLAGCGSDLPKIPTEPTWSTSSGPSTTGPTGTAATTATAVPTSTVLAAEPLPLRRIPTGRPRVTTTTAAAPRTTTRSTAAPTTTSRRTTTTRTTETASTGGPYFRSCAEAKAAGAAPLHVGEPGYRPGLDGDHDGVACER